MNEAEYEMEERWYILVSVTQIDKVCNTTTSDGGSPKWGALTISSFMVSIATRAIAATIVTTVVGYVVHTDKNVCGCARNYWR